MIGNNGFEYDGQGRIYAVDSLFVYDSDGRLVMKSNGLEFIYDNSGLAGVKYNGATYFYRKDVQGNIIAILDNKGSVVVKYIYDAWGNHAVVDNNGEEVNEGIGVLNPFRYRGYYYDSETNLYYLQTRYYDPETGRFISQDSIEYADPETINGLNLYAYCLNNPVMAVDPDGTMPKWLRWVLGAVIIVASVALSVVTAGLATPISTALGGGMLGAVIGGAVAGAVGGAISGFGISVAAQGISNGFDNINWAQVGINIAISTGIGALTGGILGGVSYLKNTTALYRAVSPDELLSIKQSGKFATKLGAFEGKQFGLNLKEVRAYANLSFNDGMYSAIVKTRVPNAVLRQFQLKSIDAFIFKSGVVTVSSTQISLLNNAMLMLKYFRL